MVALSVACVAAAPQGVYSTGGLPAMRGAAAPYSFASIDATGQMDNIMGRATLRAMSKNSDSFKTNMLAQIEAINDEITADITANISPQSSEQFRQKMASIYPSMLAPLAPIVGDAGIAAITKGITDNIPIIWAKYAGPINAAIKQAAMPMEAEIVDNIFNNIQAGIAQYGPDSPARRG